MKKKVLMTSILTIALCLTLIVGSTYALFTSGNDVNVAVTAGKLEVIATIDGLTTRSLEDPANTFPRSGDFSNGGLAQVVANTNDQSLEIVRMTPGDAVQFVIKVANKSDVALKYQVKAVSALGVKADGTQAEIDLSDALEITTKVLDGDEETMTKTDKEFLSKWHLVKAPGGNAEEITDILVTVTFPNKDAAHDNQFKSTEEKTAAAKLTFTVFAVQANGVDDPDGDGYGELVNP